MRHRKPSRPGKRRSSVGEREKQYPSSRPRTLAQAVDKCAHTISEAQPAPTCGEMIAPSERAAWAAATEIPLHSCSLTDSRSDASVRVKNLDSIARHNTYTARRISDEFSAAWNGYDFGFAYFVRHRPGTLSGIKDENRRCLRQRLCGPAAKPPGLTDSLDPYRHLQTRIGAGPRCRTNHGANGLSVLRCPLWFFPWPRTAYKLKFSCSQSPVFLRPFETPDSMRGKSPAIDSVSWGMGRSEEFVQITTNQTRGLESPKAGREACTERTASVARLSRPFCQLSACESK